MAGTIKKGIFGHKLNVGRLEQNKVEGGQGPRRTAGGSYAAKGVVKGDKATVRAWVKDPEKCDNAGGGGD